MIYNKTMLEDTKKLKAPGKGYKPIVQKKKEKPKVKEGMFDVNEHDNWLMNNDEKYKTKNNKDE